MIFPVGAIIATQNAVARHRREEEKRREAEKKKKRKGRKTNNRRLAMKFRKKPVVIEAYQTQEELDIFTLEGVMHAAPGDWIITGVNGEQYPCKPDIFEKTYEPVE